MSDVKRFQRQVSMNHTCDVCGKTGPVVFLFSMEVAPRDYQYLHEVVGEKYDPQNLFTDIHRSNVTLRMAACTECLYSKIRRAIDAVSQNLSKVYQNPEFEMTVEGDDPRIIMAHEIEK